MVTDGLSLYTLLVKDAITNTRAMPTWEEIIDAEVTNDRKEFGRMCSGITVLRQGRALIVMLPHEGFRTLSSGFTNGGFMDSATAVLNISDMGGKAGADYMAEGLDTYDTVNMAYAQKLGLDPSTVIYQTTSASMTNAVMREDIASGGIKVSAVMTAGIKHNAGRSGDPSSFDESEGGSVDVEGTIITFLAIDADLSDGAIFQAMLVATEAKSCVIQELQARSLYSQGIATGSGTDQVVVIVNKTAENKVETLERSSELSKTISECVSESLRTALARQAGMDVASQWEPLEQLARIGVTAETIRKEALFDATKAQLDEAVERLRHDTYTTTLVSAIINIQDDIVRGLVTEQEGMALAKDLCTRSILSDTSDPVVKLRLGDVASIQELLSYVSALKVIETVDTRRDEIGQ